MIDFFFSFERGAVLTAWFLIIVDQQTVTQPSQSSTSCRFIQTYLMSKRPDAGVWSSKIDEKSLGRSLGGRSGHRLILFLFKLTL